MATHPLTEDGARNIVACSLPIAYMNSIDIQGGTIHQQPLRNFTLDNAPPDRHSMLGIKQPEAPLTDAVLR